MYRKLDSWAEYKERRQEADQLRALQPRWYLPTRTNLSTSTTVQLCSTTAPLGCWGYSSAVEASGPCSAILDWCAAESDIVWGCVSPVRDCGTVSALAQAQTLTRLLEFVRRFCEAAGCGRRSCKALWHRVSQTTLFTEVDTQQLRLLQTPQGATIDRRHPHSLSIQAGCRPAFRKTYTTVSIRVACAIFSVTALYPLTRTKPASPAHSAKPGSTLHGVAICYSPRSTAAYEVRCKLYRRREL